MQSSITSIHQKEILSTEPLLTQGDRVYLYSERTISKTKQKTLA